MLEIIFLLAFIFLIMTFFYKQATHEFRIHQVDHSQREAIQELWKERIPLVIRNLPRTTVWNIEDIQQRTCYSALPLFKEYSLSEWFNQSTADTPCPWRYEQAERIATVSHLPVWEKKWMRSLLLSHPLLGAWMFPRYHCWAGRVPLRKLFALWTCILPVEGDILVTIMPESVESLLPVKWGKTFPSEWTKRDTPFVGDIKYMDIVVRPGTGLFMPPHWFVSWKALPTEKTDSASALALPSPSALPALALPALALPAPSPALVCTLSYHSPISLLAFRMSPHSSE